MYTNREEAALKLAQKLSSYSGKDDVLVLGIPRGGVVTAYTLAKMLKVPHDALVTRKIGAPNQPELAIGAVGPNGTLILDKDLMNQVGVEKKWLAKEIKGKRREVKERIKRFRGSQKYDLKGKAVILTDDGIATGATVEAAIKYLKKMGAKKLILAVPVVPSETARRLGTLVDKSVFLETPKNFHAVGQFYEDFSQVTDEEVVQLLQND